MFAFDEQSHKTVCLDTATVSCAASSRSTSAGSSPNRSPNTDYLNASEEVPSYPASMLALPEYDYPTPWTIDRESGLGTDLIVKNTFLGMDVRRPSSLAEFLEERKIQSCPPPGLEDVISPEEAAANLATNEASLLEQVQFWTSFSSQVEPQELDVLPLSLMQTLDLDSSHVPKHGSQNMFDMRAFPRKEFPCAGTQHPSVALPIGSSVCPTVGSQGHWRGACKPCAFFHTKGCGCGIHCVFCHLCAPDEKKRRAKELRAMRRCGKSFQGHF